MTNARLARLRESLPQLRADSLLVSGITNIRYLTGFTGSNGLLLVTKQEALLFTDGRYGIQARHEVAGAVVVVARGKVLKALTSWAKRRRLRRLGFEERHVSFEFFHHLREGLAGFQLIPVAGAVERLRAVKGPEEIEAIRRAVELNSAVFEACLGEIRPERTEKEIAWAIEDAMRRMGAEKPAFETIVASGSRAALPHARPTDKLLKKGDFLVIDQGVILGGYSSDMTRTVVLGGADGRATALYKAVLEAQLAAIATVRAGVKAGAVDRAARSVLDKHELKEAFVHSTGHGVGLEIHERPRLAPAENTRLEAGMVVTIEPGAYLEGLGGVRIEDMVVVRANDCEVLTPTPKDLRVL